MPDLESRVVTVKHPDDWPKSMRDADVRERRRTMRDEPHIRPLKRFAEELRHEPGIEVPDFDPLDGGTEAHLLFLYEKPGPMTAPSRTGVRVGSGFISRNNDDETAAATWRFMEEARIPREATLTWNVVPWWNGTIEVRNTELEEGLRAATRLVSLLPRLRGVVLVGKKAGRARASFEGMGLKVATSLHPSPLVRANQSDKWKAIATSWREAALAVGCGQG